MFLFLLGEWVWTCGERWQSSEEILVCFLGKNSALEPRRPAKLGFRETQPGGCWDKVFGVAPTLETSFVCKLEGGAPSTQEAVQ